MQEKHIKLLFKKIISCIQFCHNKHIYLLDIKPSNFVFDGEFNPIFINYSLSVKFDHKLDFTKGVKVDEKYKCPEMWGKSGFIGEKADIFSLGVLLFNLVTGKFGFISSKRNDPFYIYIISKNFNKYWSLLKKHIKFPPSQDFKDLYIKMVSNSPKERPRITEILKSEWMEEINKLDEVNLGKVEKELNVILNDLYSNLTKSDEEFEISSKLGQKYSTK